MSVPEGKVSEMRQTHESHRGWRPLWLGIVVSLALGGCLLALGVGWSAPALAGWGCLNLVAALGVFLRTRWGFLLMALLGVVLCAITGFVAAFSVLMLVSEGGSLDDPMFGTGIAGVLNGWASLALYGLFLAAGVVMIATARRGVKDRPVAEYR
jgi:hypothetical protein